MAELPSKEVLAKLPLRAIVAYAVRNARRVQPLSEWASERENHQKHSRSINIVITLSHNSGQMVKM